MSARTGRPGAGEERKGGGWSEEVGGTERGIFFFFLNKLTRMMLLGQVAPADSLTFHQLVFLCLNGQTIINQMSGLGRHARAGFKTFVWIDAGSGVELYK